MIRSKKITDSRPLVKETEEINSQGFLERLDDKIFDQIDNNSLSSKFRNDFMRQVYYLCKLGAQRDDMAEFFRVSPDTITKWAHSNLDFQESMAQGKWAFGMRVSETLGQRALGYNYSETEYSQHVDRQGFVHDLKKVTHKHMPPDVASMIFYLKNRHPDQWKDVNKFEVDAKVQIGLQKELDFSILNEGEQIMLKQILAAKIAQSHGISE